MAFLKFSRDKRGYENFYLLQPTVRGKSRPRLLYWFHTPPNVKVGRAPFDPEVRHTLEAQNPDVAFDWTAIVQTPIPPADTERWRERRRAERAMRAASETESAAEGPDAESGGAERPAPGAAARDAESPTDSIAVSPVLPVAAVDDEPTCDATARTAATSNPVSPAPETAGGAPARRRRRRRRGQRKPQAQVPGSGSQAPGSEAQADGIPANDSEAPGDDEAAEPEPEPEP